MLILRSLVFYFIYGTSLALWATVSILVGWLLPLKKRYPFVVQWNRFAVWWVGVCCGVKYEMHGRDKVPKHEPYILMSNHQSPWETVFLVHEFVPLCAVLKKELLRIPLFGWAMATLDPIALDRSKRRDARNTLLEQGRKQLANGISIMIFPEGTRGEPGADRKYYTGGAELAIGTGAKIVPLAHNAGIYWPAHKLVKKPGTIKVIIGDPIDPTGREPRELTEAFKQWVKQVQGG